jgi:hypothetical protein
VVSVTEPYGRNLGFLDRCVNTLVVDISIRFKAVNISVLCIVD